MQIYTVMVSVGTDNSGVDWWRSGVVSVEFIEDLHIDTTGTDCLLGVPSLFDPAGCWTVSMT